MNIDIEKPVFTEEELENEEVTYATSGYASIGPVNEDSDAVSTESEMPIEYTESTIEQEFELPEFFNKSYFEELDKMSEEIETANYIELYNLKKSVKSVSETFEQISIMINMVEQLNETDKIAKQVAEEDVLSKINYNDKYDKLREEYAIYKEKADKMVTRVDERLQEENAKGIKSKYITNCLLEVIAKKVAVVEKTIADNPDGDNERAHKTLDIYNKVVDAFSNRDNLSWIIEKSKDTKFVNKIYKLSKVKKKEKNFANYILKTFKRICTVDEMIVFDKFIQYKFNDTEFTDIFMYFLAKIYHVGRLDGTYAYSKVLIMDILDIVNGIYDIAEDDGEHINSQLLEIYNNIKASMILPY